MFRSLLGSRSVRPATPSPRCRLRVEMLESRDVPTTMFGLVGNRILIFDSATPRTILKALPITGLINSSERVLDIDVRPGTGGLYGRTNLGNLYLINPLSGFSLFVGGPVSINGVYVGFDINSQDDRIREVSNPGQNLVVNPQFGTLESTDTPLSYRAGDVNQGIVPRVTGIAYTNTFVFPPPTTLYGIDHRRNTLVTIGNPSPSDGQVSTVGSLGVNVVARVGFDIVSTVISPTNPANIAFAAFQRSGQRVSGFYSVNLTTGAATLIGTVGNRRLVNDIAVDLRNTSGFFPPSFRVGGFVGGSGIGNPGSGDRMAAPPAPPALPPRASRGADQPANVAFAIAGERPAWFEHDPIWVG